MLVVIEGVDKLGKTTLVNSLKMYYGLLGKDVTVLSDFSTPFGLALKPFFCNSIISNKARLTLIRELRNHMIATCLDPLLDRPDHIIILDRFVLSTMVYQEDENNFAEEWRIIQKYAKKMITILLTSESKAFIAKKIESVDPLERKVFDEFQEAQEKYRLNMQYLKSFCTQNQVHEFLLSKDYVGFGNVVTLLNAFYFRLHGLDVYNK